MHDQGAWLRVVFMLLKAVLSAAIILSFPPLAQDLSYHGFADGRAFFGIPNTLDVISNLPFCLVGIWGWHQAGVVRGAMQHPAEIHLWRLFFSGVFLVGLGSGYYHLTPDNHTLVWDRLPMTVAFMSFSALVVMERIGHRAGLVVFPLLLAAGIASVFYWHWTELAGQGDLRPYVWVQFYPMLAIVFMLWLFPPRYRGADLIFLTLFFYLVAKALEHWDDAVFDLLGGIVSGHSLKHVAAAVGVGCLVRYLALRRHPAPAFAG